VNRWVKVWVNVTRGGCGTRGSESEGGPKGPAILFNAKTYFRGGGGQIMSSSRNQKKET